MFESLSEKLDSVLRKLKGRGLLKEGDVDDALKEIRMALLEADVNFRVVKDFVSSVREKAVGDDVLESITPGQQVVRIVNDELCALLGGSSEKIRLSPNPPTVIMLVGLNGSGKTTTSAKLARVFKKEGRRPMLVAADLERPAAIAQLATLGAELELPVYIQKDARDPASVSKGAIKSAVSEGRDIVIIDTAGRFHVDEGLMAELKAIKDAARPSETLLVADAMTGQEAVNVASKFNDDIGLEGVILTKMDGDARGGAALSIKSVTGKPIKYIGTGEKIDMLEPFHPERLAKRILGMGDVVSLVEKAQAAYDLDEAQMLEEKFMGDRFTFDDLKEQLGKVRSMGSLDSILGMIPGMNKLKGIKVDEGQFIKVESVINSMTAKERVNHRILNSSRRKRIAKGSGTTVTDVNRVIKQYVQMRKMFKRLKSGGGGGRGGGGGGFRIPGLPPF